MFGLKKKTEDVHKGDLLITDGMYLKQATMNNGHIVLNCFLRALIVFFLVLGSIGGFLSAFDINYNFLMVIIVFLLLSMYFSFLYAATRLIYRDIGYIIFFVFFVGAIYVLRVYANSGFYSIVNNILNKAKAFFDLPGVREYEVQIDNDYLTVSIVTCFVGLVMIIVLNIWMYSIMSMFWTMLFTFPILFIPIYMKLSPDPMYIVFLMIGYMAVMIFKANGHYVVFAWDSPLKTRGLIKKRVSYTQDSTIFRQTLLSLGVISLCVVFVSSMMISPQAFERKFNSDRLRDLTSEAIGNFILLGVSSMFNEYPSTGGMSGGRLGGVSNVRPDYMTDLEVSFVPHSNDAIYLKGFTGGIYGDNQWESIYDPEQGEKLDTNVIDDDASLQAEAEKLKNDTGKYHGSGRMIVKNIGADTGYTYYPYYTLSPNFDGFINYSGIDYGEKREFNFYPKIVWENDLGNKCPKDMDVSGVSSIFLDVPEKNEEVVSDISKKIGLNDNMTEYEIVDAVRDYFEENYPYTLKPGRTPDKEDFVNYFLTKNKKGFCAHFASSAVLIFRHMGIPARYVEGYAFSMESVFASDEIDGLDPSDYYQGYSALGDAPVMKVEVSDAQAHAWVEIYVDGFGWRNVEVTPGSNEITEENDFWSAFSDFFGAGVNDNNGNNAGNVIGNLNLSRYSGVVYLLMGIIAIVIILSYVRILIRRIRRYRNCNQKNRRDAAIAQYADVCDMIRICDKGFDGCRSHKEQLEYIKDRYDDGINVEDLKTDLERMSFHDDYLEDKRMEEIIQKMGELRKLIRKNVKLKTRMMLWKR